MKLASVLVLGALVVAPPRPVQALDCGRASLPVEKLICATPELKKADDAMGAAYFKLLQTTANPDFHEALIRSQRRWLEARSHGPDRFGQAEDDKTDDRDKFLREAEPIRTMEEQRKITAKDSGGSLAGYEYEAHSCFFLPPPYGNWNYLCLGAAHRQHHDRVCSVAVSWESGTTEHRLVSVLKSGEPKPVASCSTGHASIDKQCPDPDDADDIKAIARWNTNPGSDDLPIPHAGRLWKYDPDSEPGLTDQPWMRDCLFASTYPPPEVSRPTNPAPQK
jgi:uncharacterized protein YecT (DUF1311 family)